MLASILTPARWPLVLAACAALATAAAVAQAQPPGSQSSTPLPSQSAPTPGSSSGWLTLMGQASRHTSYDGVVMIASSGRTSTVQVSHRREGDQETDAMESLDGPVQQVYRRNGEVRVLWPDSKTGLLRRHDDALGFPMQWSQADERILDVYEVVVLGRQRWAGQRAVVLQFKPRDAFRYGQRVWAEEKGGLVLRAETLAPKGQVLEWAAFTQVTLSPSGRPLAAPDPGALSGWRWLRSEVLSTSLEQEGWRVASLPPGFRLLGCVRRSGFPRETPSASGASAGKPSRLAHQGMIQAVFSDGVSQVSVFIEPFDARRHQRELLLLRGATQTLQRKQGAWWLTVVGDVPAPAVQRFSAAFERL
ncbi:MAG: hypothetical protein EOP40_01800 [Rubrivivax sp.]|nr:MAG: hypothetical protein EOP40_01800 [Rubrivivax sp.]